MADATTISIREEKTETRKPGKITVSQAVVAAMVVIAVFVAGSLGVELTPEAAAGAIGIILPAIAWASKGRVIVETQEIPVYVQDRPVTDSTSALSLVQWQDAEKLSKVITPESSGSTAVPTYDDVDPDLLAKADETFGK